MNHGQGPLVFGNPFRTCSPFLFTIEDCDFVYEMKIFESISGERKYVKSSSSPIWTFYVHVVQSWEEGKTHTRSRDTKYVVHSPLFFGEEVVTCKEGEPRREIYTRSEFGRQYGGEGKGLGGLSGPEETSSKAEVTFVESHASPPFPSLPLPLPLPFLSFAALPPF